MKVCTICKELKEDVEFYHTPRNKNGLTSRCKKCHSEMVKQCSKNLKAFMVNGYGGKCNCCFEENIKFLTIDHVDGGGRSHRKELGRKRVYSIAIQNNFPEEYQILCYNCNIARSYHGHGICPHKKIPETRYKNHNLIKIWEKVLEAYGGKCECCSEINEFFLSIDHIDPSDKNRKLKGGIHLYRRLIRENFPNDVRLLCYNCNCARSKNYGICPHKYIEG